MYNTIYFELHKTFNILYVKRTIFILRFDNVFTLNVQKEIIIDPMANGLTR